MGITNSNKEISQTNINCGESFRIRLSLTGEPDITSNPVDIVLILDRSGSMAGTPLTSLKSAAKKFIEIIDEATDGSEDGTIGGGSKIGVVSFASTATQDTQLITSVNELNEAIDSLVSNGDTNHEDAFTKALDLFDPMSTNAKVMIMFTDGETTEGGDPNIVATQAKNEGITIYSIGLTGTGGIDEEALRNWASDPDSSYVAIAPSDDDLEELFENLAENIAIPGGTNIVVRDVVSPCFRVISLSSPTKGTATMTNERTVEWTIEELGTTQSEGATFEFTVQHVGTCNGEIEVNESITYSDEEGNVVTFPTPIIDVNCGTVVYPEDCPIPVNVEFEGCSDSIEFDAGEIELTSLGRILQLDVTLRNVCPNKRVALAVLLYELDEEDNEYSRGMKTMTIPAHTRTTCQNVTVRCIKFVLPEDLDLNNLMCENRRFIARFIAHYIDTDFTCCEVE